MINCGVFSLMAEGDRSLARNFRVKEFACKDGSNIIVIDPLLVWVLQNIRDHFAKPVTIISGYRTPSYNKGRAEDSRHMYGQAADIQIRNIKPQDVYDYASIIMPDTGGIGLYSNFVHVDTRAEKARWKG